MTTMTPGTDSMRIAILDEELPFPPTSGKRIRTYHLIKRLAAKHSLIYVCHQNHDPNEVNHAVAHFRDLGIESIIVPHSVPRKRGIGFAARLLANLFSPLPYSVATHHSRPFVEMIQHIARSRRIDLWHCEWTPYAEAMRSTCLSPWIVVAHNVESMIWRRLAENEPHPVRRRYIQHQWRKYVHFERWAYAAATRCVAVSAEDADRIRGEFGGRAVDVVENGVDTAAFQPAGASRDPKTILFLGSLDWRPNQDAVRLLIESIFPAVRNLESEARLQIVGRRPPEWLRQLAHRPGIEIFADVSDVRPFLAQAGLLAVPLRIGGGSRLKILEALACETPVVSTRIGAEGLNLQSGVHLEIVDDAREMASTLVRAIRHPHRIQEQARAGRRLVLRHYDWNTLAEKLDATWHAAVDNRRASEAA
jgi:glycosyltransferase involved in cell wall biosynthesis